MINIVGWQKILILAVLLRILVMPFYFHPDIKTYNFQASFLKRGVVNIYSYLQENKTQLPLKEEFVYFPLTYFFLGGYQVLAQPLLGTEFNHWLADASQTATQNTYIFRYLFILKLPYLILDLLIGLMLCALFENSKQKKKILTLWLFNPLSIILIYAFSNLDIIVVALTILSLVLSQKGKMVEAGLALGLGAGFKAYPLLLVPFLFLAGRTMKERAGILLSSLVPFLLVIGPFLKSADFRETTLMSGLMTRITMMGISLNFNETLMLGIVAIAAFIFWGFLEARINKESLWRYYLALLLLIFSLIHFHIQWLLWILPLGIIVLIGQRKVGFLMALIFILAFSIPLLYNDKAMTVGLLLAISPLYNLLPTPFVALQKIYDPFFVQSILHSIFAGGSLIVSWQLLRERQHE